MGEKGETMNITTNTEVEVSFTTEELDILKKACKILWEAGNEIFEDGNGTDAEEMAESILINTSNNIRRIINGIYF